MSRVIHLFTTGRFLARKLHGDPQPTDRCREASTSQRITRLLKRAFCSSLRKAVSPSTTFTTVYSYLINSAYSFVDSYDEPTRYGRGRYSRKMLPDIKLHHWRKGSQWLEVNRKLAIYIISDSKYYSLFKQYCRPACYPDEHYIPTFLNMFHGSVNANRSVTWVDWSVGGLHPATYAADIITDGFLESIGKNETDCLYNEEPTSLCFLFARKFAPSALAPLMNVSSTVMGF